jgi:hypothetical protein
LACAHPVVLITVLFKAIRREPAKTPSRGAAARGWSRQYNSTQFRGRVLCEREVDMWPRAHLKLLIILIQY